MRRLATALVLLGLVRPAMALAAPEVLLRWNAVPDAVAYEIEIARDPSFGEIVLRTRTDTPKLGWTELPDRPHHWRVRCHYRWGRVGPWSPVRVIDAMVGAPIPRTPADAASIASPSLVVEFDSPPGVVRHVVEIANDPRFEAIVGRTAADRRRAEVETPPPGVYWWRVTGIDALGRPVPPSAARSFAVVEPTPLALVPEPAPVVAPLATARMPAAATVVANTIASDADCVATTDPIAAARPAEEGAPFPGPLPLRPVLYAGEASAGWTSNGGWLRAPRADAALLVFPTHARAWTGGASAGWYRRAGRDAGISFSIDVVPVAGFVRWSPRGDWWLGAGGGLAWVSTRAGAASATVVPFVGPSAGYSRPVGGGSAGAHLSWSRIRVSGPMHGDAGGVSLSFFYRPGELR